MGSRKNVGSHFDAITTMLAADTAPAATRTRGSASISAPTSLTAFSADYQELEAQVARYKEMEGRPMRIRMDLCDDGPHHTTPIDEARVARLQANLKGNPQSSPAIVQLLPDGRFNIIGGRHRKRALTNLGHVEWDVIIRDLDDDTAERLAFYDNLLAPNLTDYARFRGFLQRKTSKGLSEQQIADEAGVHRSTVNRVMSFASLNDEMTKLVEEMPADIQATVTGNLVADIARHLPKKAQQVAEGLKKVADQHLRISDLVRSLEAQTQAPAKQIAESHVVKAGNAAFAKMTRREGRVVLDFHHEADAEEVEKAVLKLLQELAAKRKQAAK